ncbi:MAG: hypothetical protein H3C62_11075 [Gemmatimonadaceae bacterium]|nr:hypothetical protein [Gemmatimonadaceae bacterium]
MRTTPSPLLWCVSALIAALPPATTLAQAAGQLSIAAGTSTDERGVTSNSVTLSPALVLTPGVRTTMAFNASATRFETTAWMLGGSAGLSTTSAAVGGVAVSLNAGASASRSSYGTTFTLTDATPALEWSVGPLTLFGGAHAASGRTQVRATAVGGPVPTPAPSRLQTVSRTSFGPVFGGRWNVLGHVSPWPLVATYREEHGGIDGIVATDRNAGAMLTVGALSVGGSVGERVQANTRTRFAAASASLMLGAGASLDVAAGRYPSDRLTGTPQGRYVAAGLTIRFGARRAALPRPRGVDGPRAGYTRVSIRAADAERVDVYGDWNNWTPVAAQRASNGVWYVDLPLSAGEYRYAFRINQSEWRVPKGAVTADDGFGLRSAYLVVTDTASSQGSNSREET